MSSVIPGPSPHRIQTMSRPKPPRNRRAGNAGVGLIEVLIAVLVMAIGLLGIAALQATALRNSQSSLERSQAVIHSYAILDAMRANLAAARNGAYNMGALVCTAPAVTAGASLVANDQARWLQSLEASMGDEDACGQIQCVVVAGSQARDCTVTVQWDDSRGTEGEDAQQTVTVTRI